MTLVPRTDGQEVRYLLPEEITTDPIYDVRPGAADDEEIELLAHDIESNGQQDALIVSAKINAPNGADVDEYTEAYTLVAGHRRRRAVSLVNTKRSALGEPLLKLRVYVDRSITDTNIGLQKAIASNLHRKNFTPLQLALLIQRLKKEFGWDKQGFKGTQQVADYLKINAATVVQHEKFLKAPEEIKAALASGELSADGALTLITVVKPEKHKEVLEKGRVEQAKIDALPPARTTKKKQPIPTEDSKSAKLEKLARVEEPALRKAIRQTDDSTVTALPLSKKEIIEHFQDLADAPAYGYPDSQVRQWAKYFVEQFVTGKGTEKTLLKKFNLMTAESDPGTEASSKDDDSVPTSKPARAVRKDAKEKPTPTAKKVKAVKAVKGKVKAKVVPWQG